MKINPNVLSSQDTWLIFFLASFLIWIMFLGILALWLIDGRLKKETALHAFFASLVAWVVSEMIKSLFPVARPFNINGETPLTLTVPIDGSFPSSHAALAFTLAITLWLHNKSLGMVYLIMAALVGWARVMSNVHYTLDIIGGAVIGIVVALLVERLHLFKVIGATKI